LLLLSVAFLLLASAVGCREKLVIFFVAESAHLQAAAKTELLFLATLTTFLPVPLNHPVARFPLLAALLSLLLTTFLTATLFAIALLSFYCSGFPALLSGSFLWMK
jgi:hypothetical protein